MKQDSVFFIAFRYLLGRGKEGGRYLRGAAIGIAVSMVPIVVTLVVADGMIQGITDRYLELGTYHAQISIRQSAADPRPAKQSVLDIPGVRGVWAERQGLGIVLGKDASSGAAVRAVEPSFLEDKGVREYLKATLGVLALISPGDALIGEALALKTGVSLGDTVRLMTARSTQDGRIIPKTALFTVRGIVSSGYRELDSLWFLISYDDGLRFLPPESSRAFLGVKLADPYKGMGAPVALIEHNLPKGYFLTGWYDLQRSQYQSYQSTRQLLLFIMAIIVIVAAVNVSSATSMLAVERRRDIAILKSFGADPGGSTRVFLFGALLTGLSGSILGLSAGVLVAVNINTIIHLLESALTLVSNFSTMMGGNSVPIQAKLLDPAYYLQVIPITIDWGALALIGAGTTLCSVLTAWAPARRAGKMMPLEILRKY